jgi:cytosine/adenosine deaminase-related metal-dependent hydrolase
MKVVNAGTERLPNLAPARTAPHYDGKNCVKSPAMTFCHIHMSLPLQRGACHHTTILLESQSLYRKGFSIDHGIQLYSRFSQAQPRQL